MPDNVRQGMPSSQCSCQSSKTCILRITKIVEVATFEFDTYGEVIAALSSLERRHAGMPGAIEGRDKLRHAAIPADEKMRRYPHAAQLIKIRMGIAVQCVGEQGLYMTAAELTGRKADVVDHQQADLFAFGSGIEIGARKARHIRTPAFGINH